MAVASTPLYRNGGLVPPPKLPPYPHNLHSFVLSWRTPYHHPHRLLGFHFKFSPAAASISGTKTPHFSFHTGSCCRQASTASASVLLEQEGDTPDLPSLPYTANYSLSVESWGTLYTGPHEAKYWNSNRQFPYTIGYTSIKSYKGKTYVQKVEEGPEGPVFTVEVIEDSQKFSSKSPSKVWNEVVGKHVQNVQGARHYGFQSHDVVKALQTLHRSQTAGPTEEALRVEKPELHDASFTSIDKESLSEDFKDDTDREFAQVESLFSVDSDDDELPAIGGEEGSDEEVREKNIDNIDDDDSDGNGDKAVAAIETKEDEQEEVDEDDEEEEDEENEDEDDVIRNDILHDVEGHHVDVSDDDDLESDDDDSDAEEEVEGDNERDSLSYDMYPSNHGVRVDDDLPAFANESPLYKQSFRSADTGSTYERFGRFDSVDEPYKEDMGVANNVFYPSDQGRSKVFGRVWRKGDSLLGRGKQKGLEKEGSDQRYSANDGPQLRASLSLNTRSWDGSSGKKRDENTRSSQMLLELLQKWNKTRKWSRDSGTSVVRSRTDNKGRQSREDNEIHQDVKWGEDRAFISSNRPGFQGRFPQTSPFSVKENLNLKNYEGQELMQSTHLSTDDGELALLNFKIADDIDESTDFAISKLFETVGKQELLPSSPQLDKADGGSGARMVNHVEKSWSRGGIGRPLNIEDYQMRVESGDNIRHLRDSGDSVKHIKEKKSLREGQASNRLEKKVVNGEVSAALKQKDSTSESTRLVTRVAGMVERKGNEETRLIETVRMLVGNKQYEDALLAIKSAKGSNSELDVDVYEALLGDIKLVSWQKEVFKHVQDGNSVLVSAPSGAGKSTAADCCLFRNYIEEHRTLVITPSENLAREKVLTLGSIFGHRYVGGTRLRMQKDHKLVVLTLDSLAKMLQELHGPGGSEFRFFFEGVNMVVLDKFHTMGEAKYGRLWEEVFMLLDCRIKVLALTLPASNEDQIVSWIDTHRGPCKLVSSRKDPVMKRYFFCNGSGLFPLFDAGGERLSNGLLEDSGTYRKSMTKEQVESFFLSGYDKSGLSQALVSLKNNAMLPGLVAFFNIAACNEAMQDALSALENGLLSTQDLTKLEARCTELGESHPDLLEHLHEADREALHRGFAACHEGKLPAWQTFVLKLFEENILKFLIVTENTILHTGVTARSIILPATCNVIKDRVSPLSAMQALPLFGSAGRRGFDIEGNVIFVQSFHSGPTEAASLVQKRDLDIVSSYKPSYSLVINLMAKYQLSRAKQLLSSTLHCVDFKTHAKDKMLEDTDRKILSFLESKGELEVKLFQGLAEVNKQKLADAAVFTRVDIRLSIHSASHGGNAFPGFLLALVPEQGDSFYMVFGADNNFRLLPAGALDHVYTTESPPLDVLYKQSTGQFLQPPAIPPKEKWTVEHDGSGGYVAAGSSESQRYVNLLMEYPIHMTVVKEGLQMRKEILLLDSQISNLIEKRRSLLGKQVGDGKLNGPNEVINAAPCDLGESDTWKEAMRLLKILEQVDALSLTETAGAYVKLKPLGMLISRLHNVDNELWVALVLTLSHVKQLPPGEFMAIIAATIPLETEVENLFNDQRDVLYRATKPLKDAFTKLEILRKQVAAVQGSFTPPLQFCTAFAGMVYAWARGKPGMVGFNLETTNDGEVAWKLKGVVRHANLISRACSQVSVDISEQNDFSSLSMLARKAEESLSKHLIAVE